ncbi:hypothetical protein AB0I60_34770 [Actinosynnema sp. NPDC050436]|uniref:helix-turn-helix domain-containing protein n=1 Tax=Actinosynnema sp. NPDC050436 TaxID=3155659 RepID=UPI0033FDC5EA
MGGSEVVRRCACGTRLARDNHTSRCGPCARAGRRHPSTPPEVPAGFWDHPDLRAALAARDIGAVIRAYRKHPHHGQAITQDTVAAWITLSTTRLSRIENGEPVNDLAKLIRWAHTLHIPHHLLWFHMPAELAGEPASVVRTAGDRLPVPHDDSGRFHDGSGQSFEVEVEVEVEVEGAWSPAGQAHPGSTCAAVASARVRRSQQEWLTVRQAPGARGRELAELAAWLYPADMRAPGGHVLAGPGWLLEKPVELDSIRLNFSDLPHQAPPFGPIDHVVPLTDRAQRYAGYSRAVRDLIRPRLLENRVSYRLVGTARHDALTLTFGTTTYFEVFDVKEALAHEFKAAWLAAGKEVPEWSALPLRSAISDPFDPDRLLMSPGINTLTIRRGARGDHRFVLHERDGGAVADGRNIASLMPAGEFQPSSVATVDVRNDFSLWRNIMREFSEEFLGNPEHDGNGPARSPTPNRSLSSRSRRHGHPATSGCGTTA